MTAGPISLDAFEAEVADTKDSEVLALLDARRFDVNNPPPKPVPIWRVAGQPIATAGNLVIIQAQAKAGKSAFVGAMLASTMGHHGDFLGLAGSNPNEGAVVHFDTEQSPADHHALVAVAIRRVEFSEPPAWLRSYRLADVPTAQRRAAFVAELERSMVDHGRVCGAILDGVADLCIDPNDATEAFGLVEELHGLAIRFHCPIVAILHENPGSEHGKTRGHLGSQLERKAETNLRLEKDTEGIVTVSFGRARHGHLPKDRGPRFAWDRDAGMMVSIETAAVFKEQAKTEELRAVIDQIFSGKSPQSYTHLKTGILRLMRVKDRTAENRIREAVESGLIRKTLQGEYEPIPQNRK